MRPDVSVVSLEFTAATAHNYISMDNVINSVKVNYSDGTSSPLFLNEGGEAYYFPETINFDP